MVTFVPVAFSLSQVFASKSQMNVELYTKFQNKQHDENPHELPLLVPLTTKRE